MTTPEKIKYYRTQLNLDLKQLASKMKKPGIAAAICRWENGNHAPEEESLSALRKAFLAEIKSQKDGLEAKAREEKQKLEELEATFDL